MRLAITGDRRASAAPDISTMSEAGLSGVEISEWFGILVPGATPKAVVSRLNEEIVKAVHSPEVRERFTAQGLEPVATTIDDFAVVIRSDIDKLAAIIKQAGIRAE